MEKQDKFRAFLAIPLPTEVRQRLQAIITQLQSKVTGVKWVVPENLHVTVRFFGDISPEQMRLIEQKITLPLNHFKSFELLVGGLNYFPSRAKPHSIALSLQNTAVLHELHQVIAKSLDGYGMHQDDHGYLPHLTLGRIKSKQAPILPKIEVPKLEFAVDDLQLFRSDHGEQHVIYTSLVCFHLRRL